MSSDGPSVTARPVIATIQMEPEHLQLARNRDRTSSLIGEAARRGAKVVVLPECCTTGLIFEHRAELESVAETVEGPTVQAWAKVAADHGMYVIAGMAERATDRLFNAAVVLSPRGLVGCYRKTHVFGRERTLFDLGDCLTCFETPWGRVGLAICYDLWFPEVPRQLAGQGATLIASPSNWFTPPRQAQDDLLALPMAFHLASAAACSNEITIACADRIGEEKCVRFLGGSFIIGPNGRPLAGPASSSEEEILCVEWRDSSAIRGQVQSHLAARRNELYRNSVAVLASTRQP